MAAAHRARRRSFGGVVLVITTALIAAALLSFSGSVAPRANAAVTAQTWSGEFDGAAGRAPDAAKWTLENGGSGFGNHELQYYTSSTSNAALDGQGHLVITARKNTDAGLGCWYGPCHYTSARLNTAQTFTQAYGRFEARIKIPRGQGIWPAFWMLGNDLGTVGWPHSGEIDIMENIGREPNIVHGTVHGTVHGPGYSGSGGLGSAYSLPGGRAFADDFRVFAVDARPVRGIGGMCVDVAGASSADGTPIQLHSCTGNAEQRWTIGGDSSLRALGKCLDVAGGSTADGAVVQLYTCNGTNAQKWAYAAAHDFIGIGANKCLDAKGNSSADGTRLQTWTCTGAANQKWTVG